MNQIVGAPARPVQTLEPVGEGRLDERQDMLVPVQEEDLPQGVLDLLAALPGFPRRQLDSGRGLARHAMPIVQEGDAVQHRDASLSGTVARDVVHERSVTAKPLPQASPLSEAMSVAVSSRLEMAVEYTNLPMQAAPMEPAPAEPFAAVEQALRMSAPNSQVVRLVPGAIPAPLAPVVMPTAPDAGVMTSPGLLQVPFNNGAASGQVTIHRLPDESARLMLSPSNALVLEQLKEPFAQAREPAWRLTDSGGEQPRQGSQQTPDDDQDEAPEHPA
ncbi:type III secretion effector protein [Pseudomonas sp. WP18]|uniref:SpaN/EivJ family type III secretion system needle length determinant n=1 Tax=Pseudomonas sp. WP18 TaxID=3118752 RepID=UPI0030D0E0B1